MLCFGLPGNWIFNLIQTLKGNEVVTAWKLYLPVQIFFMVQRWGAWGCVLQCTSISVLSVYYFTLALMNHNAEHCLDVKTRNAAKDWGLAQLHSSADWSVGLTFLQAFRYLWLNFHTVHHLFPKTDFSHHPAIQKIMLETCVEFGVDDYKVGKPFDIWCQMTKNFGSPVSLLQEVVVYAGSI